MCLSTAVMNRQVERQKLTDDQCSYITANTTDRQCKALCCTIIRNCQTSPKGFCTCKLDVYQRNLLTAHCLVFINIGRYVTILQMLRPGHQHSYLVPCIKQCILVLLTDNKTIKNWVTSTTVVVKPNHRWSTVNSQFPSNTVQTRNCNKVKRSVNT